MTMGKYDNIKDRMTPEQRELYASTGYDPEVRPCGECGHFPHKHKDFGGGYCNGDAGTCTCRKWKPDD